MRRDSWPILALLLSSIGWGLTWIPLKYLGSLNVQGAALVCIASTASAILLAPFLLGQFRHWRRRISTLLLIGLLGGFANLAFQLALYHGDVVRVMILFYLLPAWSLLGGWLFLNEGIDGKRLFTVGCALLGAFLILGGFALFDSPPHWIDLLAIGAGMAFAMNNVVFRASQSLPVVSKVAAMFWGCTLLSLLYLLNTPGDLSLASPQALWLTLVYGACWLTAIALGTQWAVTRMEVGRSSIIIIMELVVAVVSAGLLLDVGMSSQELLGAALIVGAALFETFDHSRSVTAS